MVPLSMPAVASTSTIGGRLRALRAEAGLSLRQAGARCDLSASFIRMVELDETGISIERLSRLVAVYGLEVTELMGGAPAPADQGPPLRFGTEDDMARAAIELFLHHEAAEGTVVDALARRSGTDVREHFPNDAELLVRAYELVLVDDATSLMDDLADDASAWERLEAYLDLMTPSGRPDGDLSMRLLLVMILRASVTPRLAFNEKQLYGLVIETWADVIRTGQAAGEMRAGADPERVAWQLCALIDGLSLHVIASSPDVPPSQLRSLALETAHRLLDPA